MYAKCSKNFVASASYARSTRASSVAIRISDRQTNAIHPVPSDCSSTAPPGTGSLRSTTAMLSKPRNPPSKTFRPFQSAIAKTRSWYRSQMPAIPSSPQRYALLRALSCVR